MAGEVDAALGEIGMARRLLAEAKRSAGRGGLGEPLAGAEGRALEDSMVSVPDVGGEGGEEARLREEVRELRAQLEAARADAGRMKGFFQGVEKVNEELQAALQQLLEAKAENEAKIESLEAELARARAGSGHDPAPQQRQERQQRLEQRQDEPGEVRGTPVPPSGRREREARSSSKDTDHFVRKLRLEVEQREERLMLSGRRTREHVALRSPVARGSSPARAPGPRPRALSTGRSRNSSIPAGSEHELGDDEDNVGPLPERILGASPGVIARRLNFDSRTPAPSLRDSGEWASRVSGIPAPDGGDSPRVSKLRLDSSTGVVDIELLTPRGGRRAGSSGEGWGDV